MQGDGKRRTFQLHEFAWIVPLVDHSVAYVCHTYCLHRQVKAMASCTTAPLSTSDGIPPFREITPTGVPLPRLLGLAHCLR